LKIAFFEVSDWEEPFLKKRIKGHTLKFVKEPLSEANVSEAVGFDSVSVFIYSKVNAAVLEKIPTLKLVTTRSTGFDHVDIAACAAKNITVCNVPAYGENTVAEHTFALMLSLSRNIHKSYQRTVGKDYTIEGLKGFDLRSRTIGVVGSGKIGMHVIKIARGFGMKILAYDVMFDKFNQEVFGFEYVPLEQLLKESDIITLHTPYNKYTHHLINLKNVGKVKKGALFINTARGAIIETEALQWALEKKVFCAAGLDVVEGEELLKHDPSTLSAADAKRLKLAKSVIDRPNVLFTPHLAFFTQEALERILETTVESIDAYSKNAPKNAVKPQ
jgi:D-lactate dehydrogenase